MKNIKTLVFFILFFSMFIVHAKIAVTASVPCTNANWQHSERCLAKPAFFEMNNAGEAFGELESGVQFSQTNIVNDYTRVQKFQMEEVFWYVTHKGIIYADNDLQALSIYLAI